MEDKCNTTWLENRRSLTHEKYYIIILNIYIKLNNSSSTTLALYIPMKLKKKLIN